MRKPQRKKVDSKRFLWPEEYLKIVDIAKPRQEYNIKCLINTGARINEFRHVVKKDIDKDRSTIMLWKTKIRAKLKETRPSPRRIPISSQFCKYLYKNIDKYKIYSTNQYRLMIQKLTRSIGSKDYLDLSSHNIRKTHGTWMLALGVDAFKLAQNLGHSAEMLRLKYATGDVFNFKDKDIMRDVLGDLPNRLITSRY